jgi:UDP-2,3-diacylglucosamine pyrophosphatase LpxH
LKTRRGHGPTLPLVAVYVISDLHLDENEDARLFRDDWQGRALASLCEQIARDGAELVLLGDIFDLTAMTPPKKGLRHFFASLAVEAEPPPCRPVAALVRAGARANPHAIDALARLSERVPVTLVPGNHDHQLASAEGGAALASVGLRVERTRSVVRTIAGRTAVLQHGHEHDPGNAEPAGSGEVMTQALHQAVIPFLRAHGSQRNVRMDAGRIVALRPEEAVISVLERWLDPKTFRRFFRALLRLLAVNRKLPAPAAWLAGFISVDRVRTAAERQDRLWERTGHTAIYALQEKRRLPHAAPRPDVVVFGHTHVLDWAVQQRAGGDGLYVNLGTWTERCFDPSSPPDRSLPVLVLEDTGGRLRASLSDLAQDGAELQRFEA